MSGADISLAADKADLWTLQVVVLKTGCSKSSLYRMMSAGGFPRPVRVGMRRSLWRRRDVESWMAKLRPAN